MGIYQANARKLIYLSLAAFVASAGFMARPVLAEKPGVSYDEKKRQANDTAVSVVVSGISCPP